MSEVIATLDAAVLIEQPSDSIPQSIDRSLGCGSHQAFELRESILDRIEVGAVGRQVHVADPVALEGSLHLCRFVGREIVENDEVTRLGFLGQDLFDVSGEDICSHRSIDHHRRDEATQGQSADEGGRLPVTVRKGFDESPTAWGVAVEPVHRGGKPRFIEENQPSGVVFRNRRGPGLACGRDVGPVLLGGPNGLFLKVRPSRTSARHTVMAATCR